jgi:hypothetical protein
MGRRNEINIVRSPLLEGEYPFGKPDRADGFAVPHMADGEILAEGAAQGAPGEEYGPRPFGPGNGRLFTPVKVRGSDTGEEPGGTDAGLAFYPVHPAGMGAEIAPLQAAIGLFHPRQEFA